MKLYANNEYYQLYNDNMLNLLEDIDSNSIDSIVTDPPYELGFMAKDWDKSGIAFSKETWEKCYKVLKPGGHLLVFGGSRTFYRIACAIEDAGFEIRDTIMWLYSSGMPKSLNLGKSIESKLSNGGASPKHQRLTSMGDDYTPTGQKDYHKGIAFKNTTDEYIKNDNNISLTHEESKKWKGWGTCLKPSYEPIIIARKPCENSITDNVLMYGVGGINIDECRIPTSDYLYNHGNSFGTTNNIYSGTYQKAEKGENDSTNLGRFPTNVILTYDETDEEEVCSGFPNSGNGNDGTPYCYAGREYNNKDTSMFNGDKPQAPSNYNDSGSASRYYYCAKASAKDRDEGLENIDICFEEQGIEKVCEFCGAPQSKSELCHCEIKSWVLPPKKNIHPTVKPTELMQYLIRLVTPKNGIILDPFNGSGSTGKACMWENKERNSNYKYIGIELSEDYLKISKARIDYVLNTQATSKEQLEIQVKSSKNVNNKLLKLINKKR